MLFTEFKSITEFLDFFRDEAACIKYFEQIRFKNGLFCAHCGHRKVHRFRDGKRFRCADCKKDFTIKTGTIFGESKVTLRKWFIAIYLLTTSSKGVSSVVLAKQVGVTQKTAWFIDHRIRQAMRQNKKKLEGKVEIDETMVGGKEKNKHLVNRVSDTQGRSTKTKTAVMGFLQRGGGIRASVVENLTLSTVEQNILDNINFGTQLYTDTFMSYSKIGRLYPHQSVNHKAGQYVNGDAHTNSIESFWAIFKRGYIGTYHLMSKKHLQRYVDEFCYRFNRKGRAIGEVFADAVHKVAVNDTLRYKALTQPYGQKA